jgi:hypothetical protein
MTPDYVTMAEIEKKYPSEGVLLDQSDKGPVRERERGMCPAAPPGSD